MGGANLSFCWLDILPEVVFFYFTQKQNENTPPPTQTKAKQMKKQTKNPTNANEKQNHKTKCCGRKVIKIKRMGCDLPLGVHHCPWLQWYNIA